MSRLLDRRLILCLCGLLVLASRSHGLVLNKISVSNLKPQMFEMIELTLDVQGTWNNPFDPEEVSVDVIVFLPDGGMVSIPAFFYRPYARFREGIQEVLKPSGSPTWKARFTPRLSGRYFLRVEGKDKEGAVSSSEIRMECSGMKRGGFLKIMPGTMPHFCREPDEPFFAIGENMCWPDSSGTFDYDMMYEKLAQSGGNFVRVWMGPFHPLSLERFEQGRDDLGWGRYDMENAWRLDYLLQKGVDLGLVHMLTFDSFNILRSQEPNPAWQLNPYSTEHGGPISGPGEFFYDPSARLLYKNRLRYIVARWAAYPSLGVWEFWNEVDLADDFSPQGAASWHREMSAFLRNLDPYEHPITTSFDREGGFPEIDLLEKIDIVQTHNYGTEDLSGTIFRNSWAKRGAYDKPHLEGEFGTGYAKENVFQKDPWEVDPGGRCLQEGLWAGLMSGDPGTGLSWYWSDYVDRLNLYPSFQAVAKFIQGIPIHKMDFTPIECSISWVGKPPSTTVKEIVPKSSEPTWTPSELNVPQYLEISKLGEMKPTDTLPGILHGLKNHPDLHNPVTLLVDLLFPGKLIIDVQGVSGYGGAKLAVFLDEVPVMDKDFVDSDGETSTETLHGYDASYDIDVPEGVHKILIENKGIDWFFWKARLTGEFSTELDAPRVMGIRSETLLMSWISITDSNWFRAAQGVMIQGQGKVALSFTGVSNGRWQVSWHDTKTGNVLSETGYLCSGGRLSATSPEFVSNVALKAVRVSE